MLIVETERVKLREFEVRDVGALRVILSDSDVMEYSRKGPLNGAEILDYVEWAQESYRENGYGQWAVVDRGSGRVLGCCGLSGATVDRKNEIEIGYRLIKEKWGLGLASEAARAVLTYGFSVLDIDSIVGIVSHRHSASIRVLEKIGFRGFSETRYYGWDVRLYRLSQDEWKRYNALQEWAGNKWQSI